MLDYDRPLAMSAVLVTGAAARAALDDGADVDTHRKDDRTALHSPRPANAGKSAR